MFHSRLNHSGQSPPSCSLCSFWGPGAEEVTSSSQYPFLIAKHRTNLTARHYLLAEIPKGDARWIKELLARRASAWKYKEQMHPRHRKGYFLKHQLLQLPRGLIPIIRLRGGGWSGSSCPQLSGFGFFLLPLSYALARPGFLPVFSFSASKF